MRHYLKTWPQYFWRIAEGQKKFEVRKNDRDFQVGDQVTLEYYNPENQSEQNSPIYVRITYVLQGGQFGIDPDYCVFGFEMIPENELT